MLQTPFHAYYKARLLEQLPEDERFIPVFASSDIEIYPFQIAAASFVLRSPYQKGAVLCDEAGMGKSHEAKVGSRKNVSNIPARVQRRWVLSLRVRRFSSCSNCFSLCLAAVSFFSAVAFWRVSFSSFSFMGSSSFLVMGKTKAPNFLWLSAFHQIFTCATNRVSSNERVTSHPVLIFP